MIRFLIDEQLPPALAVQLRNEGHDAVHVLEIGLEGTPDNKVRSEAVRRQAVLVTKDADFANLMPASPAVLWIRIGNVTNRVLWSALKPRLPEIIASFLAGDTLVEVL